MNNLIKDLIFEMKKLPVIDSHEHLPREEDIVSQKADIFTRIYCHYSITNAVSAGMTINRALLKNTNIPLEERWKHFKPFLQAIKNTGYARVAQITAQELYGISQINDKTYIELSEKLQESNHFGLYDNILKEKCNIKKILNQGNWNEGGNGYAVPVYREFMHLNDLSADAIRELYNKWKGINNTDFKSVFEWLCFWCAEIKRNGVAGLKFVASLPIDCVDDTAAEKIFKKFLSNSISDQEASVLGSWFMHKAIEIAPKYKFVVAIHCGIIWDGNGNFGELNPMNIVRLLIRYPNTVFDLYHGGIPWVREMAVIGNQYPNANLNLVWCHQISPFMTEHMLNEWIDLVPGNKIIGFGGDNCNGPEKTYGVLQMAYENIARALAIRVSRKQVSENQAVQIARDWFYENPKRIYRLQF